MYKRQVLGHDHLNTTEIYTHIDNDALRVAARANPLSHVKNKRKADSLSLIHILLTPVRLAGTTVTSATLHNQDYITQKDIRIGDTVIVQKAGEIIPEILEVDFKQRPEGTVPYVLPQTCPVCGAPVERDEDGAAVRCTGAECPAQLLRNLTHFAGRDAMDIDGLGPSPVSYTHLLSGVRKQLSDFEAEILGYYLDGLSCREIAGTVGKPPKSVDNAVQRIRRKVARQLLSGDLSKR